MSGRSPASTTAQSERGVRRAGGVFAWRGADPEPETRQDDVGSTRVPAVLGAVAAALGVVALVGWMLGMPEIAAFGRNRIPMAPSTALLFLCYGTSIWLIAPARASSARRRLAAGAGVAATACALVLLISSSAGIAWTVEHLGMRISGQLEGAPLGHISPATAGCFVLAGVALLALLRADRTRGALTLVVTACAGLLLTVCLVFLLGYLFGAPLLYGGGIIPPAITTVIGLASLGGAALIKATSLLPAGHDPSPNGIRSSAGLVGAFVFLCVGIVTTGYLHFGSYAHHVRAGVERQLASIVELKIRDLAHWRQERLNDGAEISGNLVFSRLVRRALETPADTEAVDLLQSWLHQIQASGEYDRVSFVDASGLMRWAVPDANAAMEAHLAPVVARVVASGHRELVDLHRAAPRRPLQMGIVAPVFDAGRPMGAIVLQIDPSRYLDPLIASWPTASDTAETLLARREGDEVVVLNELRFRRDTALDLRFPVATPDLPMAMAARGVTGTVEGRDYRGVRVLAHVGPVPDSSWLLAARIDMAEALAPTRERFWQTGILVVAVLASAGAGLGLVWRRQQVQQYRMQLAAAEALRQSEEHFRVIFEMAAVGIGQVDHKTGRWLRVNRKLCDITGYRASELLGMHVPDLLHPGDRDTFQAGVESLLNDGEPDHRAEHRLVRKDGAQVWVTASSVMVKGAGGEPLHVLQTVEDVTDRRRAEDAIRELNADLEQRVRERTVQLEDANRELESFSYSVSHDLRAPLRHIQGFAGMLVRAAGGSLSEKALHYVDVIRKAGGEMAQLIDDLLAFSRVGRSALREGIVDLRVLIEEVRRRPELEVTDRTVRWEIDALPLVEGDESMLRLVLVNLLGNALKFTRPRDPTIIGIGCRGREDERLVLFVGDNGVGFDMAYYDKLFGVFQRLHRPEDFEGTGIGLASVRRIIVRHGGRVWAESAPDQGATFYFTLRPAGPGGDGI